MRKRSGQVHSRESSATLQLTVSLLYQISVQKFANMLTYVIMMISDENRSDSPFIFDAFPGVPAPGNFVI